MDMPLVTVEAESTYILGFPMLIAFTMENSSQDTDFLDLPDLSPELPIDSLAVTFRQQDGQPSLTFGPSFAFRDQGLMRTTLMAGERKRFLVDLSALGLTLAPGTYELTVTLYDTATRFATSGPARITLMAPDARDAAELQRLKMLMRQARMAREDWRAFLATGPHTLVPALRLSPQATHQMAYHLFINAAVAAQHIATVTDAALHNLQGPVLTPEAALLRLELAVMRGDTAQAAQLASTTRNTWSALGHRIDAVLKGQGPITSGRQAAGTP